MTVTVPVASDRNRGQVEEAVPVTNDRTLTLTYDQDAGQVVLEGLPCGPAGEAGLSPAEGVDLFFDCADGRLCTAFIEAGDPGDSLTIGEPALTAVASLFGARGRAAVRQAASRDGDPLTITAEPRIMAAMSRLARLDGIRFISPVASSPLWAVEAAQLARQAGLTARVTVEAHRAVDALERADYASLVMLAAAADDAADLVQALEPELAARLRTHAAAPRPAAAHRRRSRSLPMRDTAVGDARHGRESSGLSGWLDPRLIPPGMFQHALSPDADLTVRAGGDGIGAEARLVPGADRRVLARCRARLVDPASRSVIGTAPFRSVGDLRVRAEIQALVPPGGARVEIVDEEACPVTSNQLHHIRGAMRWGQTALCARRQVSGLADAEWVRLAAHAWARCAEDWSAARDPDRTYLAAVRRAAICPGVVPPAEPSAWAKELAGRPLLVEPPFLAERLAVLSSTCAC